MKVSPEGSELGAVLHFEYPLSYDQEIVWNALVDHRQLSRWFPALVRNDPSPGGIIVFEFDDDIEAENGLVMIFDAPHLLEFDWAGDRLRFEIVGDAKSCVLDLCQTLARPSLGFRYAARWQLAFEALQDLLGGAEATSATAERHQELSLSYRDSFGSV